ncbi:MAG: imidazolonepropionase [Phycisphaerales bacterium]
MSGSPASASASRAGTTIRRAALLGRPGLWDVCVGDGLIARLEPHAGTAGRREGDDAAIDAAGRLLLPGFVDCHTHACWADPSGAPTGSHRLDEWAMKRAGRVYLEILRAGGGIMATVRGVRAASEEQLAEQVLARADRLLANGSTTIEVKSGYGLTTGDELKMLRAIRRAASRFAGTLVPTALLGHAIDPDQPRERFVRSVIVETLPRVSEEFPGIAVDAFCEQGAWTLAECRELFEAARRLGHPVRVHADQFTSQGMTPLAVAMGARSVDHLEASTPADLAALSGAQGTWAVALPACGFHLDGRYANLGPVVRGGGASRVCIATNLNPGSAPCWSMALVIALGVRHGGLSPEEAVIAATANPARLLALEDRGVLEPGRRADLVLVDAHSADELAFNFGDSAVRRVWAAGRMIG